MGNVEELELGTLKWVDWFDSGLSIVSNANN
jgi:hypothetical protein